MIEGKHPVLQAFLGTLTTWGLTGAGAAAALLVMAAPSKHQRKLLDVRYSSLSIKRPDQIVDQMGLKAKN